MSKKTQTSNTNSITFSSRIQKDIFTILEKEALTKNISINSLVNNVLGKYTELDRHAGDIELVSLTKRAITSIFNGMDEIKIK